MKFTKLVNYGEINVLCTVNLQISREINVPVMKFKKYLLQNICTELQFKVKCNKFTRVS